MSNTVKWICNKCGQFSTIEDMKCTECSADYADGVVAKLKSELEQRKVQSKLMKPKFGGDRNSADEFLLERMKVEENKIFVEYVEAQYDNIIDGDDILKFAKGDIITVTDKRSDGFMDGRIGTLEGKFPANLVKPFENNPEKSLLVVAAPKCYVVDFLKVPIGNIVTLKNKYADYYWVEFEGNEGWIQVGCVDFVTHDEDSPPPLPHRNRHKRVEMQKKQDVGPPLSTEPLKRRQGSKTDDGAEIRIILLGKTGSGKSATGNSILGGSYFDSYVCGHSITKICEKFDGVCNGKNLVIIDTPGLFDTTLSHDAISRELIRCAQLSLPGPHVFLIVLQITRFTKEETKCLEQLVKIFGSSMGDYALIVFTRSEELEREGKSIKSFIEGSGSPLIDFVEKCKNRYIGINNNAKGSKKVDMVTRVVKSINDIVNNNNGGHFTNKIIDEAREVHTTLSKAKAMHVLDKLDNNPDQEDGDEFDKNEFDDISLQSLDSGVSLPNQPLFEDVTGECNSLETDLNELIDKYEKKILSNEEFNITLQEQSKKEVEDIDLQLENKNQEVKDITDHLNHLKNQRRKLDQQKIELKNKTKTDIRENDLKLKQLHKIKRKLAMQKSNLHRKKMELRQNLSKESDSLQTMMNTNEKGCLLM